MKSVTQAEVRKFLLEHYRESLAPLHANGSEIPDDFDLLTEGIIDSFGILKLVGAIEERFGLELDFEAIDPQNLTVVGPLSAFVAEQSQCGTSGG